MDDKLARLEALERKIKALELEWDEMYDQFRRLYAKLSKRVERAKNDDHDSDREEEAPPPGARVTNPLALQLLQRGRAR